MGVEATRSNLAGYARKPPDVGAGLVPARARRSRTASQGRAGGGKPIAYIKSFIINGLWKFQNIELTSSELIRPEVIR